MLVLPDCHAAAAAELAGMHPSPRAACVLRLVAAVLRYLQQREGATGAAAAGFEARYPSVAVARLAAAARQLAALAQSAGWPALAALVAPAAIADGGHPARAALEVVGPPPAHQAQPEPAGAAQATASQAAPPLARDAGSPHKPSGGASGSGGGKLGCASSGAGAAAEAIPELAEDDCLRRVMTPRVLGAATLLAAGAVLGVGWALVSGHLG